MSVRFFMAPEGVPEGAPDEEGFSDSLEAEDVLGDDADYVLDDGSSDTPVVDEDSALPEDLKGKTKSQIAADLIALKAQQAGQGQQSGFTPEMYAKSMESVLGRMPQAQPQQAPQEDEESFRKRMNELWLEDPNKAFEALSARQFNPLLSMVASNQTQMSKELLLLDPKSRDVYEKYKAEVDEVVRTIPAADQFRNPRVYQTAVDTVRARHMDTILTEQVSDQVKKGVADALKALGIETDENGRPLSGFGSKPATYQVPSQRPGATRPQPVGTSNKPTIKIPMHIAQEAQRRGVEPKVYYRALREAGRI